MIKTLRLETIFKLGCEMKGLHLQKCICQNLDNMEQKKKTINMYLSCSNVAKHITCQKYNHHCNNDPFHRLLSI